MWVAGTPLQFRQGEKGTEGIRIFSGRMGLSASKNRHSSASSLHLEQTFF